MSDYLFLISGATNQLWLYLLLGVMLIIIGYLSYEIYQLRICPRGGFKKCVGHNCQLEVAKAELEDSLRKHKLALRSIDFGLVYIDKDYVVQWEVTDQIQQLVTKHHYVPGKHCYETADLKKEACDNCVFKAAVREEKMVKHLVSTDGMIFEITATPVYDDNGKELVGGLLRLEDVTEKLKLDSMLHEAIEKAGEANRLKSAFVANMSHEIRTPLNAIVGFSNMICQTDDPQAKEEYTKIITSNNRLLLQIIDDIFDLSKIEAGSVGFDFAPVDINEVMDNVYVRICGKNHSTDVQILFTDRESHCVIETDRKRLLQVIDNLVRNALKFTERGSITIGYRLNDAKDEVYFFVKDTGIGIASDKAEQIFERFVKLNSFVSGSGIGLSLCRMIVERMGGTIGVVSKEYEGSCFWFSLPVQRSEAPVQA
ncbi:sensor histidine kinase [Bacteroides sp.]